MSLFHFVKLWFYDVFIFLHTASIICANVGSKSLKQTKQASKQIKENQVDATPNGNLGKWDWILWRQRVKKKKENGTQSSIAMTQMCFSECWKMIANEKWFSSLMKMNMKQVSFQLSLEGFFLLMLSWHEACQHNNQNDVLCSWNCLCLMAVSKD